MILHGADVGGGSSGVDTGDIGHSLRCRSAASAYLNKTFSTNTGNPFTASMWVKRGSLATRQFFFAATNGTNNSGIGFDATDHLVVVNNSGADNVSTAVFRDPTAPLHIVLQSNGTTVTVLVNNLQVLQFSASLTFFNTNVSHTIGRLGVSALYFDGYISRVAFVGGSVEAPSSFGYQNTEINEWVSKSQSAVKAVVDAGGTNSFMLDFDDATSLTTLGYDKSSKGNNWTLNNFSLTAGTTYDHMLDVPGNSYATLNPLNKTSSHVVSEANLKWEMSGGAGYSSRNSVAVSSGKWYAEVFVTAKTTQSVVGVIADSVPLTTSPISVSGSVQYYANAGTKYVNGSSSAYGATWTTGDLIGIALNMDSLTVEFFKNGTSQGTIALGTTGMSYYMTSGDENYLASVFQWNFGQAPLHASATYDSSSGGYFRYAPPTGFKALCQRNLPDPAILNPEDHFDVGLVTGNASVDQTITTRFPPDLIQIKARNAVIDWGWITKMIGGDKYLSSNTTTAETPSAANTVTFNSTGVSLKAGGSIINDAPRTYVDYLYKMGGAAVTNNNGSISSQVSANVLAGQSVVTYTGTGANATVGHGLAGAPELVIVKRRSAAGNWCVLCAKLPGAGYYLLLNSTSSYFTTASVFNSTNPTSSVFSLGTDGDTNTNAGTHVALCFHSVPGYSKIGSVVMNSSADGANVDCGFKPKYLLAKRIDAVSDWFEKDSSRSPYNVATALLYANNSAAEASSGFDVDFTTTGFKVRTALAGTYIYYAIADVAGKYALGR